MEEVPRRRQTGQLLVDFVETDESDVLADLGLGPRHLFQVFGLDCLEEATSVDFDEGLLTGDKEDVGLDGLDVS